MPDRPPLPEGVLRTGVLAIVRGQYSARAVAAIADALREAGVGAVEVAANSQDAERAIDALRSVGGLAVGAGTVLTRQSADRFIDAGASFLVMPHVDAELIGWAADRDIPTLPGALTPTEAMTAWSAGASAIKLFPAALAAAPALGPQHLAAIRAPLDFIPFVPTGGISDANADAFISAGAVALAASSWLVPAQPRDFDYDTVVRRGRVLVAAASRRPSDSVNLPERSHA